MTDHDATGADPFADLRMSGWMRELRRRTGWTQAELGRRVGLSHLQISWIENERRCPGKPVRILLQQASDLLGMPPPPPCSIAELRARAAARAEVTAHDATGAGGE